MNLSTIPYSQYETLLPQSGNWIVGQEIEDDLIVYQAFRPEIADYAITNQKFGGTHYSFSRMTWIKPNFLWMMYRAGWATKLGQERILAIRMTKSGFTEFLNEGVYSSFQKDKYENHEHWKNELGNSQVRIQWDPDHDPHGNKLSRRAIQIGIKGEQVARFNEEYIEEITDISDFVQQQYQILRKDFSSLLVMKESVIELNSALREKYSIDNSPN